VVCFSAILLASLPMFVVNVIFIFLQTASRMYLAIQIISHS
jgi:hypothetical protein